MRYHGILKHEGPTHRAFHDDACDVTEAVQQRRWVLALKSLQSTHMSGTHSSPDRALEVRECSGGVVRHGSGDRHRCPGPSSKCYH